MIAGGASLAPRRWSLVAEATETRSRPAYLCTARITAAQKTFGIYSKKVATSDPENYLVDHFAVIYLFGPDGAPIAFLPHGSTAADVTQMLEAYVR